MMSYLKNYFESPKKNRIALVGANSQGKTYQLDQLSKACSGKVIFVESETKSDENMKNSAEKTTLIEWITELIGLDDINAVIDGIISKIQISNSNERLSVELKNCVKSYKGLIEFSMQSNNNSEKKAGSGERVLGQLIMIDNILDDNNSKYEYLIVDEPEAHLHPSLYYLIAKTLNNISHRGIKVAIATHSEEILKYFAEDSSEIIMMKNLNPMPLKSTDYYYHLKDGIACYEDDTFMMESYKKIKDKDILYFKTIMFDGIYKALFSNTVIIGEGVVEEELFNLYLTKYFENYYNKNVCSIISHGKEMIPWYISILNDIGINNLCIYDCDNEDSPKHKYLNEYIENNAIKKIKIIASEKNDLEHFLGIGIKDGNKGKYDISEIRYLYLNDDEKLIGLLNQINDSINELNEK